MASTTSGKHDAFVLSDVVTALEERITCLTYDGKNTCYVCLR